MLRVAQASQAGIAVIVAKPFRITGGEFSPNDDVNSLSHYFLLQDVYERLPSPYRLGYKAKRFYYR